MNILTTRKHQLAADNAIHQPVFYRLSNEQDKKNLDNLLSSDPSIIIHDEIHGQLKELIKSLHPSVKITEEKYATLIEQHLAGKNIDEHGVWVYYPWNKKIIHLLDEEEFVEIRTNRNRYKITREEQALLQQKKIGIVGLSVGQSIALTLAMERTCGELRLADFDTAELSNLNRIRTGVQNLGIKKTVIAAREIAEIDPFIKVRIFNDGLTNQNIDAFFTDGGKIDLLVEVCDGLDIKIVSRFKARELRIPVVMDTNDRGMLDVERFDIEPERPILHGLAQGLDPANIKDLTNEEKIPYILRMVGAENISTRLKASMIEVEQSINTWPQLASSVVLGGAITTDVCRRIFLDQYHESGRYYIDIDEIVGDKKEISGKESASFPNPFIPLNEQLIQKKAEAFSSGNVNFIPSKDQLDEIINAAILSPSAGNNQPWKFYFNKGELFVFHDRYISYSWGDYFEIGSRISMGACLQNIILKSKQLTLRPIVQYFPVEQDPYIIAVITFQPGYNPLPEELLLAKGIEQRVTNRIIAPRQKINSEKLNKFHYVNDEDLQIHFLDDEDKLKETAEIIASCDRIRILNKWGHDEFFHELRWTKEEAEQYRDGIDLTTAGLKNSELAGFKLAGDWSAIELLAQWNKGNAFKQNSQKAVKAASAMVLWTTQKELSKEILLKAGKEIENYWIKANLEGVSVHPILSSVFFFNRLVHGKGKEIEQYIEELKIYKERFNKVFGLESDCTELFLMKLSLVNTVPAKSFRRLKKDLFYLNQC